MKKIVLTTSIAMMLSLSACGSLISTKYQSPKLDTPAAWSIASADGSVSSGKWWENFGDASLNALVEEALAKNNDLAAAAIRVRRAQLQAGLAEDALDPSISASAGSNVSKPLDGGVSNRSFSLSSSVSYDADLWGKLGAERDAKNWEALATKADYESTALSIIATTINLYWQGAYLNSIIASNQANLDSAKKTQELVAAQYKSGAVSKLEVLEAEQSVESQTAALTQRLQQQTENRNAMAILFDAPPSYIKPEPTQLPSVVFPVVDAGIPASILARRPDLRAAELRLRSTLSSADATKASYFPSLSLTGSLGSSSSELLNIIKNPVGALGANILLPFLEWDEMQKNVKVSKTQYDEAVINFRQTFYQSLVDVENALSARQQYIAQGESLEKSLAAAIEAESLYEVRYRTGAVTLKLWIDAKDKRRSAEDAVAENRLNRLQNFVTIYQALGGDAVVPKI